MVDFGESQFDKVDKDEYEGIDKNVLKKIEEEYTRAGATGLKNYLDSKLEDWKTIPLNIAVTGSSGAGKSTFINTMRGLPATDPDAAKVGVTEQTTKVTSYPHPVHTNFVLSDLPGVGTPNFPKAEYLEIVAFSNFDFFLILSSQRFSENDLWLAKEVKKRKKNFYFIRTKLDQDMRNEKYDHPNDFKESNVQKKIKDKTIKNLKDGDIDGKVFLISGKLSFKGKWDFPALHDTLITNIPKLKREALTMSLEANSIQMIDRKYDALKKRIWFVATASALGGAIPLPGVSACVDMAILTHEVEEYKRQLGVDDKTLNKLSEEYDIPVENFMKVIGMTNIPKVLTTVLAECVTEQAIGFVPILGQIAGAAMSFGTTLAALRLILYRLRSAAVEVIKMTIEKHATITGEEQVDNIATMTGEEQVDTTESQQSLPSWTKDNVMLFVASLMVLFALGCMLCSAQTITYMIAAVCLFVVYWLLCA